MIIHGLQASNILKYARLDLKDLPEGQIAISGPNESGKTSIGETVCLGLFGRTFSLPPEQLAKAIKWGESKGVVQVDFSARDGRRYTVTRYLHADGGHDASLRLSGADGPTVKGVAAVNQAVVDHAGFDYTAFIDTFYLAQREITLPHSQSATMKAIVGVHALEQVGHDVAEEIEQQRSDIDRLRREITDLNLQLMELNIRDEDLPKLEAERQARLDAIANGDKEIQDLARARESIQAACSHLRQTLDTTLDPAIDPGGQSHQDWKRTVQPIDEATTDLDAACQVLDTGTDMAIAERVKGLAQRLRDALTGFDGLRRQAESYRQRLLAPLGHSGPEDGTLPARLAALSSEIADLGRRRSSARLLGGIFLLLAVALWVLWGLLTFAPNAAPSQSLVAGLRELAPGWDPFADRAQLLIIAATAAVVTLLDLLFFTRSAGFSNRLEQLQGERDEIGHRVETARSQAKLLEHIGALSVRDLVASLRTLGDPGLARTADDFASGPNRMILDADAYAAFRAEMMDAMAECEREVSELSADISSQTHQTVAQNDANRRDIQRIDNEIQEEHGRQARGQELLGLIGSLEGRIAEGEERIHVHRVALTLIDGTNKELTTRFNRDLRDRIGHIVPLMTEGRYQFLQIGEDLEPRVFSADKNDFMNLDEVSSGTQRQITFAVRLSLAQALAESAVEHRQFLVLDEPFAFFDRQRAHNTLAALPHLSDQFTQFWIIAQEFDDDVPFALHLRCSRASDVLTAGS